MPGSPASINTGADVPCPPCRCRCSKLSSLCRPTRGALGRVAGVPGGALPVAPADDRRAAVTKAARSSPTRPNASASRRTVSRCGAWRTPRSS